VYSVTRLAIVVKDGVGTVNGYSEVNITSTNLRPVARQGYVFDNSQSRIGVAEGNGRATVDVDFNKTSGTYIIKQEYKPFPDGKELSVTCNHQSGCREQDLSLAIGGCFQPGGGPAGQTADPNQLHGSINNVKQVPASGRYTVTQTWTVNWDLARQGTTQ
jgi:hypothetical protein